MRLLKSISCAGGGFVRMRDHPAARRLLRAVSAVGVLLMTNPLPELAAQTAVPGEVASSTLEPRERLDGFFASLGRDRVEEAYSALAQGSPLMQKPRDLETLKNRTQHALDTCGVMNGYEVLDERTVGTALKRITCVSLNEEMPLRWMFYFYRNSAGWQLLDLRVDDGLVELFEDFGRN